MPIATALLVAAAAYAAGAQKKDGDDDGNADEGAGGGGDRGCSDGGSGSRPENVTAQFLANKTPVELLPLERSLTFLEWPIATVSFYERAPSGDGDGDDWGAVLERLERRVDAVLRANPWLGGWLVRGKGIGSFEFDNAPRLWYDPTGRETVPGIFRRVSHSEVPLDAGTPYADYEAVLRGCGVATGVKTNPEIVNRREEPLFRVAAVPSPPGGGGGLALIVSMSHVCGDAHTYYRILDMVVGGAPVARLDPERPRSYDRKVMAKMGREEARYVRDVGADPAWMRLFRRGGDAYAAEDPGSELRGRVFVVNRSWIGNVKVSHMVEGRIESNLTDIYGSTMRSPMTTAALKELNEGDDARPNTTESTNDILVSFFWKLVDPDVGLMAVNFRGRLEGDGDGEPTITDDHAGNYANPVPYTREDYKSPALIRNSLGLCRRAGAVPAGPDGVVGSTMLPRPSPDLTFSIITNWSSFLRGGGETAGEGDDADGAEWSDGLELVRHLPIVFPHRMMEKMPKRMSFLVIFASGAEDVGCLLIAPERVMEEIDTCGVVDELIAEF